MEKSNYCFVVGATYGYIPELTAMLNSLSYVGNKQDVYVLGIELPEDFTSQFNKFDFNVIHHNITEQEWQEGHGRSEIVCRKRYWYAYQFGKNHKAVCILDADLVFVKNPVHFFEVAEKTGLVVGVSKEQNKVYGDDPHYLFNGENMIPEGYYNRADICNCPMFVDANVWGQALTKQWEWFITGFEEGTNMRCPDMDCNNIALLKYGSVDRTIVLAGVQFLSTNEQALKPYLRFIEDRGLIKTESGFPVYSFHEQYYLKRWREQQLINRHNCACGYLKADKHPEIIANLDQQAAGSMNLLYSYFLKMLEGPIKIERKNYRHPGLALDEYPTA
jgi:hypothetical protein